MKKNIIKSSTALPVGAFVRTKKGLLLKILDTRFVQHKKEGLELGYAYKLIRCDEDKESTEMDEWISSFDYPDLTVVVEKDAWFLPEKSEIKNAVELACEKKQGGSDRHTYLLEFTNGLCAKVSDIFWGPLSPKDTYILDYRSLDSFNIYNRSVDLDWVVPTQAEAKQLLTEELL